MGVCMAASILWLGVVFISSGGIVADQGKNLEKTIVVYTQEVVGGPNATVTVSAGTFVNLSGTWGTLLSADSELTEGISATSKPVGRIRSFASLNRDGHSANILYTMQLDINGMKGALTVSGTFDGDLPVRELGVLTGTGDFRNARGYVLQSDALVDGYLMVRKAEFHLNFGC